MRNDCKNSEIHCFSNSEQIPGMQTFKKRQFGIESNSAPRFTNGERSINHEDNIEKVLDMNNERVKDIATIIENLPNDPRPHVGVNVREHRIIGLLDSGANISIFGFIEEADLKKYLVIYV